MKKNAVAKLVIMSGDRKQEVEVTEAELQMFKSFFSMSKERQQDLLEILSDGDTDELLLYLSMMMDQKSDLRS